MLGQQRIDEHLGTGKHSMHTPTIRPAIIRYAQFVICRIGLPVFVSVELEISEDKYKRYDDMYVNLLLQSVVSEFEEIGVTVTVVSKELGVEPVQSKYVGTVGVIISKLMEKDWGRNI